MKNLNKLTRYIIRIATEQHDSVAQLGERHLDRVEVAGSRLVGIINVTEACNLHYQGLQAFCV
jgi:hypothetical protein